VLFLHDPDRNGGCSPLAHCAMLTWSRLVVDGPPLTTVQVSAKYPQRMIEGIQHSSAPTTAWTRHARVSTMRRMPHVPSAGLELTDAELATAAMACRAMAHQEGKRAAAMENPTTRGPNRGGTQATNAVRIEVAARPFVRALAA